MKAILEFNLPEDEQDFAMATKATKLACIISEFNNESLRKRIKYDANTPSVVEEIQKELWAFVNEYGCNELLE